MVSPKRKINENQSKAGESYSAKIIPKIYQKGPKGKKTGEGSVDRVKAMLANHNKNQNKQRKSKKHDEEEHSDLNKCDFSDHELQYDTNVKGAIDEDGVEVHVDGVEFGSEDEELNISNNSDEDEKEASSYENHSGNATPANDELDDDTDSEIKLATKKNGKRVPVKRKLEKKPKKKGVIAFDKIKDKKRRNKHLKDKIIKRHFEETKHSSHSPSVKISKDKGEEREQQRTAQEETCPNLSLCLCLCLSLNFFLNKYIYKILLVFTLLYKKNKPRTILK